MTAHAKQSLSGWEVVVDLELGDDPAWLTPADARKLAAELLAAAEEADRNEATFAAQHLRERILQRLACCPYHVAGGISALLGEDKPTVQLELDELERDGKVELFRGIAGFYSLTGASQ